MEKMNKTEHKISCAMIGYGYWGHIVERYLQESRHFQLRRVWSPSTAGDTRVRDILLDSEIEAVVVCAPISAHYEIVKECLLSGKHVFCEKPLAKKLEQTQELAELARRYERCLYTNYIYTRSRSLQYLKDNMERIGEIQSVKGEIQQFGKFYENDPVHEVLGVHLISGVLYLLGTEFEVVGVDIMRSDEKNIYEEVLRLRGGKRINVSLFCSLTSEYKTRSLHVIGAGGGISL